MRRTRTIIYEHFINFTGALSLDSLYSLEIQQRPLRYTKSFPTAAVVRHSLSAWTEPNGPQASPGYPCATILILYFRGLLRICIVLTSIRIRRRVHMGTNTMEKTGRTVFHEVVDPATAGSVCLLAIKPTEGESSSRRMANEPGTQVFFYRIFFPTGIFSTKQWWARNRNNF